MGYADVDDMLAGISSRQLTEWRCFAGIEPFGEERADLRAGIIAAVIANANRDAKKRRKPFEPQDFMPKWDKAETESDKPVRDWQAQLAIVETLNAVFGGQDLRGKDK